MKVEEVDEVVVEEVEEEVGEEHGASASDG